MKIIHFAAPSATASSPSRRATRLFPFGIQGAALIVVLAASMVGCQSMPLDYAGLNDKIANGDQVAVGELRRAFLDLEDLPERMERLRDLELQAAQLFEDEPLKLGSIGTAILDTYYGSLTGHFALSRFYEFVGSEEAAVPHRQWQARIREDMEASADGSRESPYPAVTDVEAQMYAVSLGLSPVGSIYQTGEAFPYTLLIQARPADGPLRNLYFDLGGWYESMRRQFPDENEFSPFALIGFQARRGDTAAQVAVGAFLATQGRGDEAVDWLRAASRTGNLLANSLLARIFWEEANKDGEDDARQAALDEVLENYLHAVALGSADAMYALGVLYMNEHYGAENRDSGVPLLRQAAELEHSDAAMLLAHMHYTGEGVERDLDRATDYYVASAESGNDFARRSYARFLLAEAREDPRALQWLEELAEDDDAEAMILLGNLHARGVGVKQSLRRAVGWYKDAVDASGGDANIVNEVAWTLTVSDLEGLKRTRYALNIMEDLMTRDDEARRKPEYLDTWAATYAANGDFIRAVAVQEEAVEAAEDDQYEGVREIIKTHLDAFKSGKTITETAP
ncbi:MAG TPA: tetratricopeptide repeat protein [Pseudomonadales bacterium]|jgi:TPR repeat protein